MNTDPAQTPPVSRTTSTDLYESIREIGKAIRLALEQTPQPSAREIQKELDRVRGAVSTLRFSDQEELGLYDGYNQLVRITLPGGKDISLFGFMTNDRETGGLECQVPPLLVIEDSIGPRLVRIDCSDYALAGHGRELGLRIFAEGLDLQVVASNHSGSRTATNSSSAALETLRSLGILQTAEELGDLGRNRHWANFGSAAFPQR